MSLTSIDLGLREILSDPVRRQEFFRTITQDDIAVQIRTLRKARELTQTEFAELAGMKQSAVSRIEQAEYASWTLATLFRVAGALNARWRMTLEPFEDAVKEFLDIDMVASRPITGPTEQSTTVNSVTYVSAYNISTETVSVGGVDDLLVYDLMIGPPVSVSELFSGTVAEQPPTIPLAEVAPHA